MMSSSLGSPVAGGSVVRKSACNSETQETQVPSLGQEDSLGEEMATHSSILARKIPWTEEHGPWGSKGLETAE